MLLSECDLSCHHDSVEKTSYATSFTTTAPTMLAVVTASTASPSMVTTEPTAMSTAVSSIATPQNLDQSESYPSGGNNMEKLGSDDEEDIRLG